jgi:subtilisin family serine protease
VPVKSEDVAMRKFGGGDRRGGMIGATLSAGLALAIGVSSASAQDVQTPPRPPPVVSGGHAGGLFPGLSILGGALLAAPLANAQQPGGGEGTNPPPRPKRTPAAPTPKPIVRAPQIASRAFPPPAGETRFRSGEILVATSPGTRSATVTEIARRHRLSEGETVEIGLLGVTMHVLRISDRRDVGSVVRELGGEGALASIQPNYLYATQEDAAPSSAPQQYALGKLHVAAALAAAPGEPVRVAVIDTAIDETHPDLAGAVEARFDAIGGAPRALGHGTSIAGAIAAHGRLKGVDPNVRILSARAFASDGAGTLGSTLSVLKSIDWAARERARVVNMSFAGPPDPALHAIVVAAFGKGLTLVAAAGHAGPKSPPLYPAAEETVLAITATDSDDRLYDKANVGRYIAAAAPGVDVLLPAAQGGYALETGTSVAAALVSGVVALVLERRPGATPAQVRKLLLTTAEPLGGGAGVAEFGAGLVDAQRAVSAAEAAAATQ